MGRGDAEAEYWVLTTEDGAKLLQEVQNKPSPGPSDLARWRKSASADQAAAALRLATTRSRAAVKFSRADQMWLEPVGLEQATAETVALAKAQRFDAKVIVDLCAGIGGDAIALAKNAPVLTVDADHGMCRRVRWNAEVYGVGKNVTPIQAKAEVFQWPQGALVHVDPDRRTQTSRQGRAQRLQDYAPSLEFLTSLPHRCQGGAVKLGPASDFAEFPEFRSWEIELVSLRGECKEATAWFGALATCQRRASVLPSGATWTDRDGPDTQAEDGTLAGWIYDPDPSLSRARLLDGFSVVHSLKRVAPTIDFLTASHYISSPFLSAFEVLESSSVDLKQLRKLVARHELGVLEIKTRGLKLRPEDLRRELRPSGPNGATLFLWGGHVPSQAVLAKRKA